MATKPTDNDDDFSFEIEGEEDNNTDKPEIVVEDDTPEEDRGREPLPEDIVKELEADPLDDYSEKVKQRLKQMKKVWHDERREKERESREKTEALTAAQRLLAENRKLKQTLSQGETAYVDTAKRAAELELEQAKQAYRQAYEAGDTDAVVDAQDKLTTANYKLQQVNNYRPSLQEENFEVPVQHQQVQAPQIDPKTKAWQERNGWWGVDEEMTASALGLDQKLYNQRGPQFVGSDEYWGVIDKTMRQRFPEYFGEDEQTANGNKGRNGAKASVVAPASRSTSAKKVKLTTSQVAIARKLGLTPEQYARELMKMEQ